MRGYLDRATAWSVIERHTELFVCFGGIPLKNTMVSPGGASQHPAAGPPAGGEGARGRVRAGEPDAGRPAGVPRSRVAPGRAGHGRRLDARPRQCPGRRGALPTAGSSPATASDSTASSATSGAPSDGTAEDPGVGRAALRDPGRDDSRAGAADGGEAHPDQRELVAPAHRARRAGAVDGRDAGGDARSDRASRRRVRQRLRLARLHRPGAPPEPSLLPCPSGRTRYGPLIPFARFADMLLQPGEPFDFDGQRLTYPRIRLVYWCGGNPFHHHQDLARLRRALATPGHDRRPRPVLDADGAARRRRAAGDDDARAERHRRLAERPLPDRDAPGGRAVRRGPERVRDLQPISPGRSASATRFTEGRDEMAWLRHLYEGWREKVALRGGPALPGFDEFWALGSLEMRGRRSTT